ncbi:MAG TPA: GNAT family N-acetyltransferase [Silvibacterium sp.]|nr:GNAT family N-acetyltransferase [Silvibacterium sp.]
MLNWSLPEQQSVLTNLLELYLHDLSHLHDLQIGLDGRFGYQNLPLYWSRRDRHPFLIKVAGGWAGFVLLKRVPVVATSDTVWDMAEFFLLRRFRGRGIGILAAHAAWRNHPGNWQVRVMQSNAAGLRFWNRAIAEFCGTPLQSSAFEQEGRSWQLFSFQSKPAP